MKDQLRGENLAKKYGNRTILTNVSLKLNRGEVIGVLGPNGAGKTTCFSILLGFVKNDKGKVILNGKEITNLPVHLRAKQGLGYLPQESSIFRKLSVNDNILAILQLNKELGRKEQKQKLDKLIAEFELGHIRHSLGMSLSGGERRRVEIARALATNPTFILLDEPFAGVDPISVSEINRIIIHLKDRGLGVLITDHNVRETLTICERAYIIGEGTVIAHGSARDVLENNKVRQVYLGENYKV